MNFRRKITYANVMSSLALFIAIGGTGYAASQINGSLLLNQSVSAAKLKPDTLGGGQIKEKSLGKVPASARADSAAAADHAGRADNAGHASAADSATNAGHAGTADSSTNAAHAGAADTATNAGHAGTADNATNAGHAGTADSATNAGHASTADSAAHAGDAGTADSAINADHAGAADSAINADHAGTADSAAHADDASTLGGNAASAFLRPGAITEQYDPSMIGYNEPNNGPRLTTTGELVFNHTNTPTARSASYDMRMPHQTSVFGHTFGLSQATVCIQFTNNGSSVGAVRLRKVGGGSSGESNVILAQDPGADVHGCRHFSFNAPIVAGQTAGLDNFLYFEVVINYPSSGTASNSIVHMGPYSAVWTAAD